LREDDNRSDSDNSSLKAKQYWQQLFSKVGETGPVLLLYMCIPYSSETNLKVKQAITVTSEMEDNLKLLSAFDGEF